ncbi:MAG: type II toxin-antitoxin system HipA family toxin [Bacteroidales bacterium]|nr:type II toxin-antitoxin system HipA family toxin [Bacteroidales bacterium]
MIIRVSIWDKLVGSLIWNEARNVSVFEYDPGFVNTGLEVSPFLMPLKEKVLYEFPNLNFNTYKGLPPMLADSLPDDFGNQIMNAWLSMEGKTVNDLLPLERLGYTGKRGMGALEYEPVLDNPKEYRGVIQLEELVDIANKVFASKQKAHFTDIDKDSLIKILHIGTSAGGARPKAILALDEENNVFKAGDILHGAGHSYWVLKLDGVTGNNLGDPQGYGKIEYAYYRMAVDCDITMAESKLVHENNRSHFLTRRFDRREEGDKIHMQSLSGLAAMDFKNPNAYSYEQVFTVLRRMKLPYNTFDQQFRRMVFNIVAKNQDDHTRNISLLMNKGGEWSLSPAYDIIYSNNPEGLWTNRHQLSVNGKSDNFEINDLLKVGKENNIKDAKAIIESIIDVVSQWPEYAKDPGVDNQQIESIKAGHRLFLR